MLGFAVSRISCYKILKVKCYVQADEPIEFHIIFIIISSSQFLLLLIITQGYFSHWLFGENRREEDRPREKHRCERDALTGCLPHVPGLGLRCPWLESNLQFFSWQADAPTTEQSSKWFISFFNHVLVCTLETIWLASWLFNSAAYLEVFFKKKYK